MAYQLEYQRYVTVCTNVHDHRRPSEKLFKRPQKNFFKMLYKFSYINLKIIFYPVELNITKGTQNPFLIFLIGFEIIYIILGMGGY